MRTKLEEIVRQGADITDHYLASQQQYKLFRHQGAVYAVRYEDNPPRAIEHIEMWKSHNSEPEHRRIRLDKGVEGVVFAKTEDKVVKHFKNAYHDDDPVNNLKDSQEMNLKLLDQKFLLRHLKIDKHFIIGLHNNKRALEAMLDTGHANIEYIMPKIERRPNTSDASLILFIHALKKANENGLSHPDYCLSPMHTSFQNEFYTDDGIKLFDLDMGLNKFSALQLLDDPYVVYARDQWLLVYNHKKQQDPNWRNDIQAWYDQNPGKALSENPEELLGLVQDGSILLPRDILEDLEQQVAGSLRKPKVVPPLILAAKKGDLHGVQQLIALEKHSSLESKDELPPQEIYNRALITAAQHSHTEIVKELISAGADVNVKDKGRNAMSFAIQKENVSLVKILLNAGVDRQFLLYQLDEWNIISFKKVVQEVGIEHAGTTLLESVKDKNSDMVKRLVTVDSKCSFINHVNESQKTALMLAAARGDKKTVKFLLKSGADYMLQDNQGKTAGQLAVPPVNFKQLLQDVVVDKMNECMQKLNDIAACQFNADDQMTAFMQTKKTAIKNSTNLSELLSLHKNLSDIHKELKPVSDVLKKTLTELSSKKEFGARAKAKKIEMELVKVPVEERNLSFDYESPVKKSFPVLEEMARPRGVWGAPGKVEVDKKSGVIIEDKAASTYKEFRKTMDKLRKSTDNSLSSDSDYKI